MIDDWKRHIGIAYLVKQQFADLDTQNLWPFHLPEVAASKFQIKVTETALGEQLDAGLRGFLAHANGWRGFLHAIDLFGTEDLVHGLRNDTAHHLLDSLEPLEAVCGFSRAECLPIGVSQDGIDVFVISRTNALKPGVVCWLAGQLIDRFPSFDEFFLSMVDYNRAEAEALKQ